MANKVSVKKCRVQLLCAIAFEDGLPQAVYASGNPKWSATRKWRGVSNTKPLYISLPLAREIAAAIAEYDTRAARRDAARELTWYDKQLRR